MTSNRSAAASASSISSEHWDAIIVGGGAAGLSAALILARARRRVLVLDAHEPRNRFAPHMHGVLSRDGSSPLDLVATGSREVRAADGVIVTARVVRARSTTHGFEVETDDGTRATSRHLVVATGIRDQLPDIPGLAEQWGRGVVACPYCDGYEASGRAIGVLVSSPRGVHKAHMLRPYSDDITVFAAFADTIPESERRVLVERGVRVEDRVVTHVVSDGDRLVGLALADGTIAAVDVVFAEPSPLALDEPLRQLGADLAETPMGPWIAVDAHGRTSVPRLWAIGNSGDPSALVPVAMGMGAKAALTINGELVAEEVAAASARLASVDPAEFWEARYLAERGESGRVWSGDVNAAVAGEIADLEPGTALELGCGEGGDALWLADKGWGVTAVDISANALAVAAARAEELGTAGSITWVQADLATWQPPAQYDLVTSAFLHSPVDLPRELILRRAASAVAPGGRLLVVGHAAFGADSGHRHAQDAAPLPTPDEVLAALDLGDEWVVEKSALVERETTRRDGRAGPATDTVLRVRRLA